MEVCVVASLFAYETPLLFDWDVTAALGDPWLVLGCCCIDREIGKVLIANALLIDSPDGLNLSLLILTFKALVGLWAPVREGTLKGGILSYHSALIAEDLGCHGLEIQLYHLLLFAELWEGLFRTVYLMQIEFKGNRLILLSLSKRVGSFIGRGGRSYLLRA